jgi:hypothetical protein
VRFLNPESLRVVSKPLFFSLVADRKLDLAGVTTPTDVYANYFSSLNQEWGGRSGFQIDFAASLEDVAYLDFGHFCLEGAAVR